VVAIWAAMELRELPEKRLQDRHLLPLVFTNLLRAKPVKMVLI
jgi:hypothetical protein